MGFMIRGGVGTVGWSKYLIDLAEDKRSFASLYLLGFFFSGA